MRYFDTNVMIGMNALAVGNSLLTAESLIQKMDYIGIEKSLVGHFSAKEWSPENGNLRLLSEIEPFKDRLVPAAVWTPFDSSLDEDPESIAAELVDRGFKAIRIFPKSFSFMLEPEIVGNYFAAFARRNLPILIEIQECGWEIILRVLKNFSSLPVIVLNEMYRNTRNIVPLLQKFPNFYFEISGFEVHRGLESVISVAKSRQIVFGSRLPVFGAGSAKMMVDFAIIPEHDRQQIASGNLERLLEKVG